MTPETADAILKILGTLIDQHNDLAVKVVAAERVFWTHSRHLFDDYVSEIGNVKKILNLPAAETVLADLREKMLRG